MRKVEFAWIEQILSFESEEEFQRWLQKRHRKAEKNLLIKTLESTTKDDGRFYIRIKSPYNQTPMEVNINEFFGKS